MAKFKQTPKLPDKPSELIKVAIRDLEAVERSRVYAVSMGQWHTKFESDNVCYVCLAGSVMAKTFKIKRNKTCSPASITNDDAQRKLYALNAFRIGDIVGAFNNLNMDVPMFIAEHVHMPTYSEDKVKFKSELLKLAKVLKAAGY
jgi:hypothetical protein